MLELILASPPDREQLVAEIWNGRNQCAEISWSSAGLLVELYGPGSGGGHLVAFEELRRLLDDAARELAHLSE